jgi:DNA 3'-phosphatase
MNDLKWEINDNFIFGIRNFKNKKEIKQINLFDLDSTLITTQSGRVFAKDKDDWKWLYTKIPNVLDNNKFLNGIVSNQSGLKTKEKIKDWVYKINKICSYSNISFVFASIGHNKYRKPMCHSWFYIKNILKIEKINIDDIEKNKNILYIGDACGRKYTDKKNDFSDTDIKFSKNCELKFKTPEIFFKPPNYKKCNNIANISYPNLKYYNSDFLDKLLIKINNKIENKEKVLIMFIGFQASGKSFLRKFLIKHLNNFKYFNNDDIINYKNDKNNKDYKYLVLDPLYQHKIIDDNTNINTVKRLSQLTKFNDYYKIGISFDFSDDVLNHLNHLRMYEFNKKLIPKVAYNVIKKNYDKTKFNEKFDIFIKINKLFYDYKNKTFLKYYF